MSSQPNNLWPEDFGVIAIVPPVVILKEQAGVLSRMTKNIVEGEVRSSSLAPGGQFYHTLGLVAPALGGYRYELIGIYHDIQLYPADVVYLLGNTRETAHSEEELKDILRNRFADDRTKKIISALIAQSSVQSA
ncbi:MAG TPA: hypothetical protein VN345_13515 [Blastocatellia bacterium]|jgi:hypothetical protein|nr:hypothetical protein [Blastocatellia bacterium]